jgi:hypothetical protein
MSWKQVWQKIKITGFDSDSKKEISSAIKFLYDHSDYAQSMLERVTNDRIPLKIEHEKGVFQAVVNPLAADSNHIELDTNYLKSVWEINDKGQVYQLGRQDALRVYFAHELSHYEDKTRDPTAKQYMKDSLYTGGAVDAENEVRSDLNIINQRTSYYNVLFSKARIDEDLMGFGGKGFTNGKHVDGIYTATKFDAPLFDVSKAKGSHLVIDVADETGRIVGGEQRDFLYGFGGDDVLEGGGGDDFLFGGTGFNTMRGGKGKDTLYSAYGADSDLNGKQFSVSYMYGGSDKDTYYVTGTALLVDPDLDSQVYLVGQVWNSQPDISFDNKTDHIHWLSIAGQREAALLKTEGIDEVIFRPIGQEIHIVSLDYGTEHLNVKLSSASDTLTIDTYSNYLGGASLTEIDVYGKRGRNDVIDVHDIVWDGSDTADLTVTRDPSRANTWYIHSENTAPTYHSIKVVFVNESSVSADAFWV